MLLTVSEAVPGRQYLTSKGLVPVVVRGPAPKRTAMDNPMWTLVYQDTGKTIDVPGSYDLTTPDVDSPLLGTAPRVDAFALNTVAWGRERVPRLSDADLELLAEIDTRPGIRTAISAEVLRRGEARAKVAPVVVEPVGICPYDGEPIYDLAAHAEAHAAAARQEYRNADCLALSRQPDPPFPPADVAADDDFEAPVFGDLPVAGEPLTPVDDAVAAAFPEVHPEHPVVVLDAALVGATPAVVPTVAEVQPTPRTLDGLEDVFGDRPAEHVPAEPGPRTEHHSARDLAIRELGADFVDVARTIDTGEIALTVVNPTAPGCPRSFEAPTLDAAIIAAREWLATMRAPVEPRRKRRVSPPPVSPPSPEIEALTRRIAELETGAKDYCGLMEDFDKSRAINLELEAKVEGLESDTASYHAEGVRLQAEINALREHLDDAGKSRAGLLATLGLSAGHGWNDIMFQLSQMRERLTVAEAEIAHLRSLKIEGGATPAPFPANLSQAGADRARKVQAALRALADTVPWTTAAGEAEAALRELGTPGFGP